jgi:hypothetical protein
VTEPVTTAPPRWTEYVPLDDIKRHPDNPKRHAAADIEASVTRFGYTEAVLVCERTGLLAAGHGRLDELERARSAGEDPPEGVTVDDEGRWCAPVQRGWASKDDAELRAYLVASNRLTEKGGWDERLLVDILSDLRSEDGGGLDGVGYSAPDIDAMLANLAPPIPPDQFPDVTEVDTQHTCPKCGYAWSGKAG